MCSVDMVYGIYDMPYDIYYIYDITISYGNMVRSII